MRVGFKSKTRQWTLLLFLGTATSAYSATLSGSDQIANPGSSVPLSLMLASGGQSISGVEFDLVWDPTLDVHVTPGAQAGISNKLIYASVLQPRVLRCLIAGINSTALADGELLRLMIAVNSGAPTGLSHVKLINLSATGGNGTPVFLQAGAVGVQIQNGAAVPPIQSSGVLSGASLLAGPISPGEIVTLLGSISTGTPAVRFNDVPATVIWAGLNQVNAIVPFGLDLSAPAQVEIQQGASTAKTAVPVAAASPAIFTLSTTGIGPGAILNQDYTVNSVAKPAAPGSVIMIYGTGFGALSPLPADGQIAQDLATTASPVTATIDGLPASVWYAGAAPELINGAVQVNVQVPPGAHTNPAAPISLTIGSYTTQPGVTVSIK